MSDDRKYRQRGYQDDSRDRERSRQAPSAPRAPREEPVGPRTPNLMGSHTVFRCTRCGNMLDANVAADDRCSRCGVDVHSCIQCVSFDPGAPLECSEKIPARVSPKDVKNTCTLFSPRTTVERQTSTGPASSSVSSARQAFDDLFK
jgi:hypothetical protein